jgi:hypothetical protein
VIVGQLFEKEGNRGGGTYLNEEEIDDCEFEAQPDAIEDCSSLAFLSSSSLAKRLTIIFPLDVLPTY